MSHRIFSAISPNFFAVSGNGTGFQGPLPQFRVHARNPPPRGGGGGCLRLLFY